MMRVADVMNKMIAYSNGVMHDINHFQKVHSYARTIGVLENLDEKTLYTLEVAAILHDIACPLCREKYGAAYGDKQEIEGMPLVRAFFEHEDMDPEIVERVVYLVGHHHSPQLVDGIDYQILLEADFLVNADECEVPEDMIRQIKSELYRTSAGIQLLDTIYLTK